MENRSYIFSSHNGVFKDNLKSQFFHEKINVLVHLESLKMILVAFQTHQ